MEKNQKRLIIFMPSIEGGGVEKNLFIISNFQTVKAKILGGLMDDKKQIKICGYSENDWNRFYAIKTNYDEFQLKICQNN